MQFVRYEETNTGEINHYDKWATHMLIKYNKEKKYS